MNFARNIKCLECEEPRPKKQLTGGEWECLQCSFFNYWRNLVCLRCDCKRPGEVGANNVNSTLEQGYSGNSVYKSNTDSKLIENEGKVERWFGKVSQPDINSAATDEDLREIMPPRKGQNKFVGSTRKTPLERKLFNSHNQKHLGSTSEGSASQSKNESKSLDLSIRNSLDQILGCSSSSSGMDAQGIAAAEQKAPRDLSASPRSSASGSQQSLESNLVNVPFVRLQEDMFCKQNHNLKTQSEEDAVKENCVIESSSANPQSNSVTQSSDPQKSRDGVDFAGKPPKGYAENDKRVEQDEKSERWFQKVAELHNVKNLPSAISDEDFPEIMPMCKGESRFVVSKKKDRSLTSPAYKRQVAVEQASNSNFVPFVPFPPGYFAKKDAQGPVEEHSGSSKILGNVHEKPDYVRPVIAESNSIQETGNLSGSSGQQSPNPSGGNSLLLDESCSQNTISNQIIRSETQSGGYSSEKSISQSMILNTSSLRVQEKQNNGSGWTGKSLEGSAVKEPDPMDMSEEAKAERWSRRVAQIKDISELSQIPDEDFPSIMPMRKGVNRFVVSKRKTPLERRLTSPQHRRNLPTVRSDPTKEDG